MINKMLAIGQIWCPSCLNNFFYAKSVTGVGTFPWHHNVEKSIIFLRH
jgi:hypothetical protein